MCPLSLVSGVKEKRPVTKTSLDAIFLSHPYRILHSHQAQMFALRMKYLLF